jgi:hypothetical protein
MEIDSSCVRSLKLTIDLFVLAQRYPRCNIMYNGKIITINIQAQVLDFLERCHTPQSIRNSSCASFAARSTVQGGTRPILRPYYMVSSRTPTIAFETDLVTEWLSSNTCRCSVLHEMFRLCASLSRRCCPIAPMRNTPTRLILVGDPRHLYL